jgi:hypothetical protein
MLSFDDPAQPSCPAVLHPHPDSRCHELRRIEVRYRGAPQGMLVVSFLLEGELDRLRIPAARAPFIATDLWRHTCCEVFIRCAGQSPYCEFNLAPSGGWSCYAFTAYREGAPLADERLRPVVNVDRTGQMMRLDAAIPVGRLALLERCPRVQVALSAVVENEHGELSYWALAHPPGRPDFHHPLAFAIDLEGTALGTCGEAATGGSG